MNPDRLFRLESLLKKYPYLAESIVMDGGGDALYGKFVVDPDGPDVVSKDYVRTGKNSRLRGELLGELPCGFEPEEQEAIELLLHLGRSLIAEIRHLERQLEVAQAAATTHSAECERQMRYGMQQHEFAQLSLRERNLAVLKAIEIRQALELVWEEANDNVRCCGDMSEGHYLSAPCRAAVKAALGVMNGD